MTITAMNRALVADAIARDDDARLGSVGIAQTGIDVRRRRRRRPPLPAGEIGEVLVRGPTVMQGYWSNPEATRSALADGWLHTGDVGASTRDGFLTLKDRSKDLIISGGSNIYPREVEEVLLPHPDVAEVAVIGRPHSDWGEEVDRVRRRARRGAEPATGPPGARARRALPRAHRAVQAAEGVRVPARAAEEQRRQGAEDGAAPEAVRGLSLAPVPARHYRSELDGTRSGTAPPAATSHDAANATPIASAHNVGRMPIVSASSAPASAPAGVSNPAATCQVAAARPRASGGAAVAAASSR